MNLRLMFLIECGMVIDELVVQLRRSTRPRIPFTCHSPDEYILLIDGGELKCYEEAMEIGAVSRFLSNLGREHSKAMKWILRYLWGTSSLKICFGIGKPILCGYTDSDMVRDVDSRKSTFGYLITFVGGVIAWQSRLQKCVALSIEADQSAIHLSKNPMFYGRFKHIDVRYHSIRDVLDSKLLRLKKIHIDDNGSDMLMKNLLKGKFKACRLIVGLAVAST
ncbi:Retrotransposon Tto1 DNA, putative [Theobroma cacao]|uniref:Retrotransposon Tto1 DNA, putative n=1 Tax=Theobroma cacao TaxID=3641 RepID=A0A061EC65_THECC|nr:Retrotransposon Tto1 DNA, putative [Theobroma cacao]